MLLEKTADMIKSKIVNQNYQNEILNFQKKFITGTGASSQDWIKKEQPL